MTKITLEQIKSKSPCENGWKNLLKSLNKSEADDTEVSIAYLLESNGISDTLWVIYKCIAGRLDDKINMCADFAESVLHIWENWAKDNAPEHFNAPRNAINIFRDSNATDVVRNALGDVWDPALFDVRNAAWDVRNAAWDASLYAARNQAYAAAGAANAAADAADIESDARIVARNAALSATRNAAVDDASDLVWDAWDAEEQKQKQIILKYFGD